MSAAQTTGRRFRMGRSRGLQRYVAVLFRRILVAFGIERGERGDEFGTRLPRPDHLVDEPAFGRDVWIRELLAKLGDLGCANRLRIGTVHEHINLAPKWYLGAYNFYLRAVAARLLESNSMIRRRR